MKLDDPIALLRSFDPATENDVEALAGALDLERVLARPPGRRRGAWLLIAAVIAATVLVALVTNPVSRNGGISSAAAKAQVAHALELHGNWHVTQTFQSTITGRSATPHFSDMLTMDSWHAADGRLLVAARSRGETVTSLYADGRARIYDSRARKLIIRRFATAADMRDQERWYLPPSAADLYDTAYRVGRVRLAGVEKLHGRRVYRLAFDWLGSSYTLIFDADRRVPISSESRLPNANDKVLITRVRYTAYERVQPGARLARGLELPRTPAGTKVGHENPLMIPMPVQGASATRAMRAIGAHFPASAAAGRARWVAVRRFPGGGVFAGAILPPTATGNACYAYVEIAHPGGAARPVGAGCPRISAGFVPSQDGTRMLVSGFTQASGIELRFANGARVRPTLRDGVFLATPPIKLFQYGVTIVRTYPNGAVRTEPLGPVFPGAMPSWLTG